MSIEWDLEFEIIDIEARESLVRGIATDTEKPDDPPLSFTVQKAKIDTEVMANNIWILDEISGKYQVYLTAQTNAANFINELKAAGKTNLEARV